MHQRINPYGRGLGLSISKQIVELLNGVITVKSQVGYGTEFTIKIETFSKINTQLDQP